MRQLPNFGEFYGASEAPSYTTDTGVEIWLYRKVQKIRFFDRAANQIGPEHSNVYMATVWAFAHGWTNPSHPNV
jgi:hypothetical protein